MRSFFFKALKCYKNFCSFLFRRRFKGNTDDNFNKYATTGRSYWKVSLKPLIVMSIHFWSEPMRSEGGKLGMAGF